MIIPSHTVFAHPLETFPTRGQCQLVVPNKGTILKGPLSGQSSGIIYHTTPAPQIFERLDAAHTVVINIDEYTFHIPSAPPPITWKPSCPAALTSPPPTAPISSASVAVGCVEARLLSSRISALAAGGKPCVRHSLHHVE